MRDDRLMTSDGFLESFLKQDQERPDHPFSFLLGAGASKQSGIPTGSEMAIRWLTEMHLQEDFDKSKLENWATAGRLEIPGFNIQEVGRFYPQLYERRFRDHAEMGYAFLESQMDGKEPSYGYSVLSRLDNGTRLR